MMGIMVLGWRAAAAMVSICALDGCALLLGVDDLRYLGPDGAADAGFEADVAPGDGGTDACEASVATDPSNCGVCGRSCLGGTCDGGSCQPVHLGTGAGLVTLASDGTTLFVRDSSAIRSCPVAACGDGGAALASIASPALYPRVRTTTTSVVWNEGNHVFSCAKTGCAPQSDLLQSNTNPVIDVWVSDFVFWISQATTGIGPFAYTVGKCPLGGGVCSNVTAGANGSVRAMTGRGFDVYWAIPASNEIHYCSGSCGVDASTATTTTLNEPFDVVADGTTLWAAYVNGTTGGVARVRTDLSGALPFATSPFVTRLVKDSSALYFIEASKRQLLRCAAPDDAGTCSGEIVRQASVNIDDLAIDDAALYWIENQTDIFRLAR